MMTHRYDTWASTYEDSALQPAFRAAHEAVLGQALRLLPRPPSRVLDVGCGTGNQLRSTARCFPGSRLIGVDPARGMLLAAVRSGPENRRPRWIQAAAEGLPFADATFDLVLSTASIRHWIDVEAGVREIGRVLAPGGLVGLADLAGSPSAVAAALASANLDVLSAHLVDGYGPIVAITVVLAGHRGHGLSHLARSARRWSRVCRGSWRS